MKNFNFLSNLLQRVSAMSGMRAETINYDGQPTGNRQANMTSMLRHCKASDVRVAQEWCESGARVAQEWYESGVRVAQEWCESGTGMARERLQKSSARVAQGLRKSVRFAATILVLLCIGVGSAWGAETKTEGFETKSAGTSYQGTVNVAANESDCGISWEIYYGTVSTSSKITGGNSVALRLYTSNNYGYLESKTNVTGLTKVTFNAKAATSNSASIKIDVEYSTDNGSSWSYMKKTSESGTDWNNQSLTTSSANYSAFIPTAAISTSSNYRIKISINSGSTKPSKSNAQLTIDDVVFTYTLASGYSITYHCNGATSGCPSNANSQTALPSTLPTPTRTGCTFAGWYTNEGLTSAATAGATLSANANLYAKWTTNVTLNRNGATETINNVVVGTALDDIDGTSAQGGCSEWTFVGWSKTQRAAQNNSTAMDLVTTVDGPGPYYAVYSHTESGSGTTEETASVTMSTYASDNSWGSTSSTYQKTIVINSDVTAEISSGTNSGKYYNDGVRIYQSEDATVTITTTSGELSSVKFTFTINNTGTLEYNGSALTSGTAVDVSGTNAVFSVGNSGSATNGQVRFTAIEVKYEVSGGSTTYYSTTASCCEQLGSIKGSISLTQLATPDPTKLKATWSMNATTGIASYTLKVYDSSDNLIQTINNYTSGTEITGLTPCTTYYVELYTVSSGSSYCEGGLISTSSKTPAEGNTTHSYTYTINKTNVSLKGGETEAANSCEDFMAEYVADSGYDLPATITVTGASSYDWEDGVLMIDNANVTGNVSVTISATCVSPDITADPADADYYVGDAPTPLSVTATLASGTRTYLWKVSTNGGSTWSDATGTNNAATYSGASLSTASAGTLKFKCIVGNSEGGCSVESGVATITITAASYFPNGKTLFFEAKTKEESAWKDNAQCKAWFRDCDSGCGEAPWTYWQTDGDSYKKYYAVVIPSTGNYPYVTIQRFSDYTGNTPWGEGGAQTYSTGGGSNVIKSTCASGDCLSWSPTSMQIYLRGDITNDEWASNIGEMTDQNGGIWSYTYANYSSSGSTLAFKLYTNYNTWIGNTTDNSDAVLEGMKDGSTYNITATYNIVDHSLTMSKTFVKGTVHFNLQGHGSAISDLENVAANATISAPSAPSATGWDFGGWYKEAGCTNAWNFASDVVTETMTLYAQWTKHNYTISSTLTNVTSNQAIPDSYEYTGSAAGLSYTLTAAAGYSLPASVTVSGTTYTWDQATGTLTLTGTIASDVSITVVALPTVTWIANGSEFATQSGAAGTSLTNPGTPDNSTYCDGVKVFVGWTGTQIVGETNTQPVDLFTSAEATSKTIPASGTTYYAVFAASTTSTATIKATSDDNGDFTGNGTSWSYTNSGTTISFSFTGIYYTSKTPHTFTITGNNTGTVSIANGLITQIVSTISEASYYIRSVSSGASVSAVLENKQTITFTSGSGTSVTMHSGNGSNNSDQCRITQMVISYKRFSAYATTCSTDPRLSVEPTELDFGDVANGTYKEMTFSLSGTNLAENASIAVSGTNSSYFTVSPSSVNKGSGTISATDITVRYTPGAVGDGHTATVTVTSGEAEEKTVTLTGNSKATYSVSVSPTPSNGTVAADKTSGIMAGETVTLTITPSSGYALASISANSGAVTLNGSGNTRTFTMPSGNVTIAATFEALTYYTLVTDVSELSDGDLITIGSGIGNSTTIKILHTQANNNRNTKEVTTTAEGKILETDISYPIRLDNDANGWKLYDTNNSGYLYATKGSNYLKNSASPTYNDVWKIAIVQTSGQYQYQAQIHLEPCNSNGCGQETRDNNPYDRYIEFNGTTLSAYLFQFDDGYIYKKELSCERLAAPTGLSAGSLTQTTATLSWTAVANASGYEVSLDNGSSWTSAGTNTSYSATSLTQGTTYNWKVRATGDGSTYCAKGSAASSSFTTKRAVKVTYTTNGATGGTLPVSGGVVNLTEGDSHTVLGNTGSGGSPTPLTKSGYTWAGWHNSTTYSATPAYTVGGTITVTENITLYANWMPKRDTFIDGVHGTADQYGDGANYTVPSCSDQSRATSGDCEQKHYKFIGWALIDADLTNPANIISAGGTRTATGATYYAVWGEEL